MTVYCDPQVIWQRVLKRIIVTPDGCWLWRGAVTSKGYGCVGSGRKGKTVLTHRLSVLVRDGFLDDELTVDHECHNRDKACAGGKGCRHRRCVNPDHLDPVEGGENTRRRARDKCSNGHRYTPENTGRRKSTGRRICLTCQRAQAQKYVKGYGKPGRPSKAARAALNARQLADTG